MKWICGAAMVWVAGQLTTGMAVAALSAEGQETAERINQRLHDIRIQCSAAVEPAYQCTGVLLKGTLRSKDLNPWSSFADPKSSRKRGVVLSWFRADSTIPSSFRKVVSGLVFFPVQQTPGNREKLRPIVKQLNRNEVWVEPYEKYKPQDLPIEAFFFLSGNLEGLRTAQYARREFFKQTGITLPILALVLNPFYAATARFVYDPRQQNDLGKCSRYIQSAKWSDYIRPKTRQKMGSQLKIIPTECGRTFAEWDADLAYAELARDYGRGPRWSWKPNSIRDPMRRQYSCLRMNYSERKTWDIETFRSYTDGVKAKLRECNP